MSDIAASVLDTDALAVEANSFASANGIQVERKKTDKSDDNLFLGAPMSLLPNAYPEQEFKKFYTMMNRYERIRNAQLNKRKMN